MSSTSTRASKQKKKINLRNSFADSFQDNGSLRRRLCEGCKQKKGNNRNVNSSISEYSCNNNKDFRDYFEYIEYELSQLKNSIRTPTISQSSNNDIVDKLIGLLQSIISSNNKSNSSSILMLNKKYEVKKKEMADKATETTMKTIKTDYKNEVLVLKSEVSNMKNQMLEYKKIHNESIKILESRLKESKDIENQLQTDLVNIKDELENEREAKIVAEEQVKRVKLL